MIDTKKRLDQSDALQEIPIDEIDIETGRIRKHIREEDLEELKDSIATLGLLQPIVIMRKDKRKPTDKQYRLLSGLRRVMAHQLLAKPTIRAIVLDRQHEERALALSLAKNIYRTQPSHGDLAEAVTKLYHLYEKDINRVAKTTGMWKDTIRDYINVKEYGSEKILKLLDEGLISLRDAKSTLQAALWKTERAEKILDLMVKQKMTRTIKKRFTEYVRDNPGANLKEAVEKATEPRIERRISIDVTLNIRKAVDRAMEQWEMEAEEILSMALEDWLEEQGYLIEEKGRDKK